MSRKGNTSEVLKLIVVCGVRPSCRLSLQTKYRGVKVNTSLLPLLFLYQAKSLHKEDAHKPQVLQICKKKPKQNFCKSGYIPTISNLFSLHKKIRHNTSNPAQSNILRTSTKYKCVYSKARTLGTYRISMFTYRPIGYSKHHYGWLVTTEYLESICQLRIA